MSFDNIDIITGRVLASGKCVDIDDYCNKASSGVYNYFENHEFKDTTELERIDTAIRIVLAPHLKEIEKLEKQLEEAEKTISQIKLYADVGHNKILDYKEVIKEYLKNKDKE